MAIDEGVAGDEGLEVGDRIGVAALGPAQQYEIVGIAKYGDLSSIGGATFAIFDVPTAQKLLNKEGQLDAVQAAAADGTTPEQLTQRIRTALGGDYTVRTGVEEANEQSSEIATFTTIIRYFLLSFAGIALFVGAFVIFNTLSITVAQRMREFATLRTLGASRRQVLRSVILEAFVIGFGASVVGLFSGLGLAVGLNALFKALNLDLPQTETVFATRTVVVSLLVGTLVTLVAGLFPAIRATRVPPIAAVREGATLPRGRFARFTPYIASLVVALAVFALAYGTLADSIGTGDRFALLGVGVLALFIGVAMLSSRLVRPLVRLVGIPARHVGGAAGTIAERNAQRNPGRTAATAAALMIGIALVTFISVLANGLRVSNSDAIERQIQSDLIVTSQDGYSEFPAAVGDRRRRRGRRRDRQQRPAGHRADRGRRREPHRPGRPGRRGRTTSAGRRARTRCSTQLGDDGALLPNNVAEDRNLAVGDTFTVRSTANETKEFVVRGIYEGSPFYPLLGSASVSQEAFDELYDRPRNRFTLLNVTDGRRRRRSRALERALDELPGHAHPDAGRVDREGGPGDPAVPAAALRPARPLRHRQPLRDGEHARAVRLRAHPGAGNAARGRHDAPPARRMVRHESVITALIGAALGLPLGIFLAALVTNALGQYDLRFELPDRPADRPRDRGRVAGLLAAITPGAPRGQARPLEALPCRVASPLRVTLCDVGPRDGLQNEPETLAPEVRAELVRRLAATGLPRVEAVSFVNPERVPQMAGAEEVVAAVGEVGAELSGLVLNERGWERLSATTLDRVNVTLAATE